MLASYELRVDECELLEQACRTLDDVESLRAVVARDGPTSVGSKGQVRVHPAVQEVRQQRLALGSLLRQLSIPDGGAVSAPSDGTVKAQRAARARWDSRTAVRGA